MVRPKENTMPKQKDLKRLIRERMEKTGESYTAARAHLIKKRNPDEGEYAEIAGMRDEAVQAKTGKTWKEWVDALDAVNATSKPHREIAQHVAATYDEVSDWWAQQVTVGYERIRGLREAGQRRGGGFDVNKSKTFHVPVADLYDAFAAEDRRPHWLTPDELGVRTANANKSIRGTWGNGTLVDAYFTDKGDAKSSVSVQHRNLPDKAAAEETRAMWTDHLAALGRYLTSNGEDG